MTGEIDTNGFLETERAGVLKHQWCFSSTMEGARCGGWCPQFGEPRKQKNGKVWVPICQGRVLVFDKLDDRRGKTEG